MTYEEQLALEASMSEVLQTGTQMLITADLDKKQRAWASEEAEKAYQRQLEAYNLGNEYNSPTNQMNRLREAGLNPHLMYGQGNVGNTTVSMPKYEPAEGRFTIPDVRIPNMVNTFLNIKTQRMQQDIMAKQTEILEEEKNNKIIENVMKTLGLGYDYGALADTEVMPKKYGKIVDYDPSVTSMKDYQLDARQAENALLKQRIASEVQNTAVKEKLAQIATKRLESIDNEGYDVFKKTYQDQLLDDLLNDLPEGSGAFWKILPSIIGAIK